MERMNEMQAGESSKKERREQKREDREKELAKAARTRALLRILLWAVLALVVAALAFGLWKFYRAASRVSESLGPDFSRAADDEGAAHISEGTRVEYKTNPPTSGNHWSDSVGDGVYEIPQPDEGLVHALEHGRVWISYKPDISAEVIERLEEIGRSRIRTVVTPRPQNETDIAIAAWTRFDAFNLGEGGTLDEKRILDFITRFDNTGPEKNVPAQGGRTYTEPWYKN